MSKKHPFDDYFEFIGWFITDFAKLEFQLRRLLFQYSGLSREKFEIFVGFPRTQNSLSQLKKVILLIDLNNEAKEAIDDAFDHLVHIIRLRDWIVHYGGHPLDNGKILIRLKPTETSKETQKAHIEINRDNLWNALSDFQLINNIIFYRLDAAGEELYGGEFSVSATRQEPWRYIPPKLEPRPKGRRG